MSSDSLAGSGTHHTRHTEAPSPTHDPLIGSTIENRYVINTRLARGGMATVYIAHDTRLDRNVAVKVMHPHLAEDAQFIARFDREARSAARINHPAVVSVSDQGNIDGRPFLVMDLIDGPNLRTLLRTQGSFSLGQALNYTSDILHALRAAAREGVIHRDIKPENVMLPADGPARVTDFGLAKAASETTMSMTGNMLGTVTYMAPEIATTGIADCRTDLYSVGIMLYEMLTGFVPWHGDNAIHIAYSHVHDDVPSPSEEQPWIPREVDDFVAALTARSPQERLSSAAEALAMLDRMYEALPADTLQMRASNVATSGEDSLTELYSRPLATSDTPDKDVLAQTAFLPSVTVDSAKASSEAAFASTGSDFDENSVELTAQVPLLSKARSSFDQAVFSAEGTSALTAVRALDGEASPAKPARSKRRRLLTIILIVFSLLTASGAAGTWWWFEFGPGAYIELPVTEYRPVDEVRAELEKLGLKVDVSEEFSDDVPIGSVISSVPASATSAHKDSLITLVVSKGVDLRIVPALVGKTRDEAQSGLTEVGLKVGSVEEVWSEDIPAGQVISQGTEPETSVRVDSAVNLTVSKGREPRSVPDLVGKTREEVDAALSPLELIAEYQEVFSDEIPEGTVISQETAADTKLFRHDKVALTVSKGPELVAVPEISGKSREQAVEALEAAGFKVEVSYLLGGIFGTAHSTDPKGGTLLKKGSTVTLTVV